METEAPEILVVEDEQSLAESLAYNFRREGFEVRLAADGQAGIDAFDARRTALVVLDLMLPKVSGLDVCRDIRTRSDVPIIILTAKDSEADKVAGLELGADDYVTKPFSIRELVSRVRANLRRRHPSGGDGATELLRGGSVEMNVATHEVRVRGEMVTLTPKEFDLLETLLRRRNRLLTRERLIDEVWGSDYYGDTKTLDVHVKRLRQKIEEDPHRPRHLVTVRGLGYKFVDG